MSVLDDGITLEERAQRDYAEARDRVSDPSARKILALLAAEEEKHAEALEAMKSGAYEELEAPYLLKEVRGLIEGAVENGRSAIFTDEAMRECLQHAMEIEQATKRFYEEQAKGVQEETLRGLFVHLAAQEREHYLLVSSLAEYFDRPAEWVESAEFGLRPEY